MKYLIIACLGLTCFNAIAQQWVDDTIAKRLHIKTTTYTRFSLSSKTTDSSIEWYDTCGKIIKSELYDNVPGVWYPKDSNLTKPSFKLESREYFIRNNKEQEIYHYRTGYTSPTDSFPDKTSYKYDSKGNIASETDYYDTSTLVYKYNKRGQNTLMREKGLVMKFSYNSQNEIIKMKDRGSYGHGCEITTYFKVTGQPGYTETTYEKSYDGMKKQLEIKKSKSHFNSNHQQLNDTIVETTYYKTGKLKPSNCKYATALYYYSNGLLFKMLDTNLGDATDISPWMDNNYFTYTYY